MYVEVVDWSVFRRSQEGCEPENSFTS